MPGRSTTHFIYHWPSFTQVKGTIYAMAAQRCMKIQNTVQILNNLC